MDTAKKKKNYKKKSPATVINSLLQQYATAPSHESPSQFHITTKTQTTMAS
jgi:hypothetical protein